ncbi:MAG: zinc metallopeptidase [Anaerolineae bacterium]|nr:zinc metallopeptidase [Anaerolineae bacterium]
MIFFDPLYIMVVMLPALVLSGLAQLAIRSAYNKWSQVANSSNATGNETARVLMRSFNLGNTALSETPDPLGDHFDPRENIVRLSTDVARRPSVAAMAIAAHEFGHVQQYAERSPLIAARTFILPVAQFGSSGAFILILLGLFLNIFAFSLLGLLLFGAGVLFSVLTLPVEIDASRRAMRMLDSAGLLRTVEDRRGAQAVLTGAALTYLAAMTVALLNFAYYAMLVFGNRE